MTKHSFEDKPSVPKCNPPRRAGFGNEVDDSRRHSLVRVGKIGTKGETGGWSDPASIMVT